jgi:hypothetical protein
MWVPLALIASALAFYPTRVTAGFLGSDEVGFDPTTYVNATTEMAIPYGPPAGIGSLTGPDLTISFGSNVKPFKDESWGNWSGASPLPDVLWTTGFANSMTMDFSPSSTVTTFGFEAEPAAWALHDITAEFYNGLTLLGTILFSVDGDGGAQLFAATLDDFGADLGNVDKFTRVVVSSDADFAIGRIRYAATSSAVPEPGAIAMLLGAGAIGIPALIIRRRRANRQR